MPLDLCHDPARVAPSLGLVAEAAVKAPDLVGWAAYRTCEQVRDLALENSVGGQADCIPVTFNFQEVVDLGRGERCVGPEIAPLHRGPVPRDHRLQHVAPALGRVDIAGPQGTAFEIPKLVEHEPRVIAGAA